MSDVLVKNLFNVDPLTLSADDFQALKWFFRYHWRLFRDQPKTDLQRALRDIENRACEIRSLPLITTDEPSALRRLAGHVELLAAFVEKYLVEGDKP